MSTNYPLAIDQGADWAVQIQWSSPSNTPYTVMAPMRMEIRGAGGELLFSLSSDDDGTSAFDTIDYNSENGLIQLQLESSTTATFAAGTYVYDLFVSYSDSDRVRLARLLNGNLTVSGRVTQNL